MADQVPNPVEPDAPLKRRLEVQQSEVAHPPQAIFQGDSAVTKAEKVERNGSIEGLIEGLDYAEPTPKRVKLEDLEVESRDDSRVKVHGIALVKPE